MRINKKYIVIVITSVIIMIIMLKGVFSNDSSTTTEKFLTVTPFIETDVPKPTQIKELELTVTIAPRPTQMKEPELTVTITPRPTQIKESELTVTITPKPTQIKESELTVTITPRPTQIKEPELIITNTPNPTQVQELKLIITNTPTPMLFAEPDLLESLDGKRILFSTGDEKTFSFNVRDYDVYQTGTIGTYYIEYGSMDNEVLTVSVEEKVNYIYTNFPHLEDSNWYYFNNIGYCLTVKPLKEGTTQVYFRFYQDENHTKLYDELSFIVEVDFISEDDFIVGEYNPILSGYPYKEHEWKYGEDIVVSVWANKEKNRAVLVAKGIGEMWDSDMARKNINTYSPWSYSEHCNYVQKIYELHIGEGITHVEDFSSIAKLEIVTFPTTLKSIGKFAFKNANFKELIFPEGLEVIGERAFLWCYPLENIVFPSTLKYIGANAFGLEAGSEEKSKNKLKEIIIPENVEFIGRYAFGYRYHTNIVLPKGLDTSGFEKDWNLIPW